MREGAPCPRAGDLSPSRHSLSPSPCPGVPGGEAGNLALRGSLTPSSPSAQVRRRKRQVVLVGNGTTGRVPPSASWEGNPSHPHRGGLDIN
eukprot:212887-Alexandrium_andersonii.AAC.1